MQYYTLKNTSQKILQNFNSKLHIDVREITNYSSLLPLKFQFKIFKSGSVPFQYSL